MAWSASTSPDSGTAAYGSPVEGSITSTVRPSLASTYSPPTKLRSTWRSGVMPAPCRRGCPGPVSLRGGHDQHGNGGSVEELMGHRTQDGPDDGTLAVPPDHDHTGRPLLGSFEERLHRRNGATIDSTFTELSSFLTSSTAPARYLVPIASSCRM